MQSMEVQLRNTEGSIEPFILVRGCLNVSIGDKSVAALCDTGASVSAIKQSFLDGLTISPKPIFSACNIHLYLADNSMSVANRAVTVNFSVGKIQFCQKFVILPELSRPIILGCDFLETNEAHISFKHDAAYKKAVQPITALAAFDIPPYQEATFLGKVVSPFTYTSNDVGLCENWDRDTCTDPP